MFRFFLARELGMTVAELGGRISSLELSEWQAYHALGADQAVLDGLRAAALSRLEKKTRKRQ